MTTDNGFEAWFMGTKNGRRPNFQSRNDRRERAAWEAGRASRDWEVDGLKGGQGMISETRDAAWARVRELETELLKAQVVLNNGADDSRWRPGESAVDALIRERDAALGMVATLREALEMAVAIAYGHLGQPPPSLADKVRAKDFAVAALHATDEAARQHEERIRSEERERCAKVAESYEPRCESCPRGVAAAIRALGSEKP